MEIVPFLEDKKVRVINHAVGEVLNDIGTVAKTFGF